MYSYSPVLNPCSPVPVAVSNPSLAFLFDVGCCGLELAGMNVDAWPTADVRVSSLGILAGKPHATGTHQASLRATLSLALLIKSFAFFLYLARFSFRCAFRSWWAFFRASRSSGDRDGPPRPPAAAFPTAAVPAEAEQELVQADPPDAAQDMQLRSVSFRVKKS